MLVPELAKGDVFVMGTLSSDKEPRVREMIGAAGINKLLYLLPYSPDFNPIEMAFSKLKALLRKAEERSIAGLWDAIGTLDPPRRATRDIKCLRRRWIRTGLN